jgi:hypothetical protein
MEWLNPIGNDRRMRRRMAVKYLFSLLDCASDVGGGAGGIRSGMRDGKINARTWAGIGLFLRCRQ